MAKNSKRGGKAWKNGYANYKNGNTFPKNKIRKLTKYVLENPQDIQAAEALKKIEKNGPTWVAGRRNLGNPNTLTNDSKANVRHEMLKRELKSLKSEKLEHLEVLQELRTSMLPKVKKRGKRQRVPSTS